LNDLTFFDVVAMQRACRRFRPEPVPDADIVRMLDAAVHAPSAENAQPWVFPAVQNLLLAASALGYGSALTTLTTFAAEELRAVVELPAGVEPLAVVPLGRPAHALGPPRRDPAASKTHLDRYGLPFATRDLRHS